MSDYISRQAALAAFGLSEKSRKYGGDHSGYDTRMLYEIQDTLEDIPAADAREVKRGKWIDRDGGLATCSECGDRWGVYSVMNFCPNCGADVREEDD